MFPGSAQGKGNRRFAVGLILRGLLICWLAGGAAGAATNDGKDAPKRDSAAPAAATGKIEARNNAASLLADLLGQDKNVSKILIIKHNSAALGDLIKKISKAADEGSKQIEALAKSDSTLNLKAMQLPPGEQAARNADGKTQEHELLSSSGDAFAFNLLMTQAEALGYGTNLAKVAAENSSSPDQVKEFHSLEIQLGELHHEVLTQIRTLPPLKPQRAD